MADIPHIAAPLRSGRLNLKNRIVHAAILTRFSESERATECLIAYHANRARGGAALIITEAVNALPIQAGRASYLNAHSEKGMRDLAKLADAVRVHDCRILAQLQERGRGNYDRNTQRRPVAPSALPDDLAGVIPRALLTAEVEQMIDDFAAAARRLERAGFDGVEISAGHGHLFHQFLSAHANHRIDGFGGDLDRRSTFLRMTIDAVRSACSADFILALKLPAEDGDVGGIGLNEAAHMAQTLATPEKVDIVSFAWGAQNHALHWHVPDGHAPRMPYVERTARLRRAANGVPVMALGRIVEPAEAETILAAGQADLIGLGRALIADPNWPCKALSGRSYAIRTCVSCNTCWGAIARSEPLVCDTNPDLGTLAETLQAPAILPELERHRLVIVGGGVAGTALAASAAVAGHETLLFHRGRAIGGRAARAALLPGGKGLQGVYGFDATIAANAGAKLELGVDAQLADIISLSPDNVVLATGAEAHWPPDALGDSIDDTIAPPLGTFLLSAFRHQARMGHHLVLIDREDSIWCYRAAQYLTTKFDRVTVLTRSEEPAGTAPLVVRQGLIERLAHDQVTVVLNANAEPSYNELAVGMLGYVDTSTGTRHAIESIDVLTHASPRVPRIELLVGLNGAGIIPIRIGDAFRPRALLQAVAEGREIGRSLKSLSATAWPAHSQLPGQGTNSS
jgi:2,4-dienoyl-CoA reductase-like NADH-dependent reductase (Old Yellow Enzyme family)/thioredoxin reductase